MDYFFIGFNPNNGILAANKSRKAHLSYNL